MSAPQKRVLVVHYHYLPVHNVAVKQLASYVQRLQAHGWQPTVLTRDWTGGIDDQDPSWGLSLEPHLAERAQYPIHRVPARAPSRIWAKAARAPWPLRKGVTLARLLFGDYPDESVGWIRPAVKAARTIAKRTPFDAVLTYCPPETNHIIGRRLARRLGVPWVPFFGDLWQFFLAEVRPSARGILRKALHHYWMSPAAACAAVSPYMVSYLERTYRKPAQLILAGFDPGEFEADPPRRRDAPERLVVSHVGSLYPLDQKPAIFFDGLDELLRRHPEVERRLEVRFVGSKCESFLRDLIRQRPCERVCTIQPKVDSAAAVALVKASDGLLAFNCTINRKRHGTMSYPSKIFEAFGARKPILAMPPDGDWVDTLLARTNAGVTAKDADEVAAALWSWYSSWLQEGGIAYRGSHDQLQALTVETQVKRLAALLDSVTSAQGAANKAHHERHSPA